MSREKVSALYFSPTGNTKFVCETIANYLGTEVVSYDLTTCQNRARSFEFDEGDVVVIGVPCYYGRMPDVKQSFFEGVKGKNTLAVLITTYGNREYEDTLLEMKNEAEAAGFKCIAAGAFITQHCLNSDMAKNRPDDLDRDSIKQFAELVKEGLTTLESSQEIQLRVGGNFPYKEVKPSGMVPVTLEHCGQCMACQVDCPMGAISPLDAREIDKKLCILCGRCIKYCPTKAKELPEQVREHVKAIGLRCTERKEPEFFYSFNF